MIKKKPSWRWQQMRYERHIECQARLIDEQRKIIEHQAMIIAELKDAQC